MISKSTQMLILAVSEGVALWLGWVLAIFGIMCLCSKRFRNWAEGKEEKPKEWKRGGWWYR